jgi:hypothetical protein
MKKKFAVLLAVVLFVSSTAFAPLAKKYVVLVHNNTEEDVKISMKGPEDYTFTVGPGWTEKVVEEGEYEVVYKSCDSATELDLDVTEDLILEIEICPEIPVPSKFVVYSHVDTPITFSLVRQKEGGSDYGLATEFGRNKYYDIGSGWYFFSYEACGTTFSGEVRVLKNGSGSYTIKDCTRSLYIEAGINPNPTKLLIKSHYAGTIDVTLLGPSIKYLSIPTGDTRVDLVAGTYTYVYAYGGQRIEGTVVVEGSGRSVLFLPFFFTTGLP